jgi:K+-transporting ATPase ATPase A chain
VGLEYAAVAFTIVVAIATSVPLGLYVARVFQGERTLLDPVLGPIERLVLRLAGVDPAEQQDWKRYARSLLVSNDVMWLATFAVVTPRSGFRSTPTPSTAWSRRWPSTRSRASPPTRTCRTTAARPASRT